MCISLIDNIKIIRPIVGEPAFEFMPRALKILGPGQVLTHILPISCFQEEKGKKD